MKEYNDEVKAALSAPVPAEQIKQLPSGVRYTTDKFVQDRLDSAVGTDGWEDHYTVVAYPKPVQKVGKNGQVQVTWIGTITCDLTVLGVTKSANYDLEFTEDMYGTPSTNSQATAFKRAAMKHGIARELWKGTEASGAVSAPARSNSAPSRASSASTVRQSTADSREFREPAPNVIKWLTDLHVPEDVARGLNGKGNKDNPSQASQVITALMQERNADYQGYNDEPDPFIQDALAMYAPDLLTAKDARPPVPAVASRSKRAIKRADEEDDE